MEAGTKKTARLRGQAKKDILIIEDEEFLGNLLIKKLENSGFYVRSVFDGEAGLKAVEKKLAIQRRKLCFGCFQYL